LGWEALIVGPEVELGLALPLPALLHPAAIAITAIPRLAAPHERSLNPMALTYSR
jgi:hypothetical protein